jgi:hypothetical protein
VILTTIQQMLKFRHSFFFIGVAIAETYAWPSHCYSFCPLTRGKQEIIL